LATTGMNNSHFKSILSIARNQEHLQFYAVSLFYL
jgi:hypothetical protein